ncbi:MAG: TIGR00180 family glycosyltransferase, partial [Candidatus Margulisiibacteriota bacterium]
MITIMIPTMNRSDFLIPLLNYYVDTGYKHWISIGDSSTGDHLERNKEAIARLKGKLKINYHEYPGVCISKCIKKLTENIATPYAVFVADDDFIVPNALERCLDFLEKHPDYAAAHGKALLFSRLSLRVGPYGQRAVEGETAAKRLLDLLGNYTVTLFSVMRAEIWQKIFKYSEVISDRAFSEELLPVCLSVVSGKIKHLDCFYLLRQHHDRRAFHLDVYDRVTSPNWFPSYQIFTNCLVEELVRQDGITMDEAREVVKQAFWSRLSKGLVNKYQSRYGKKTFKSVIKQ